MALKQLTPPHCLSFVSDKDHFERLYHQGLLGEVDPADRSLISVLFLRHQYLTFKLQIYDEQIFFFSIALTNKNTHLMVGFQAFNQMVGEIHFNKGFYQREFYHDIIDDLF